MSLHLRCFLHANLFASNWSGILEDELLVMTLQKGIGQWSYFIFIVKLG